MVDKKLTLVKRKNSKLSFSFFRLEKANDIKLNNPIFKLFSNFSEIQNTAKKKVKKIMKYFYFNRNKIIKILYEQDQVINIDFDMLQKDDLSEYFYLTILIEENKNMVDFIYSFEFIEKIDNEIKENNDDILRNLIKSKIIFELLKYFNGVKNENNVNKFRDLETKNMNRIKEIIKKIKDSKIEIN